MGIAFRHTAGFGKRMEYKIVGDMLMEGLDCYLPLVDDHGVDCVIKKQDGTFIEIQIKARSREVTFGDAALFAAIEHSETPNFYFIFYSNTYPTDFNHLSLFASSSKITFYFKLFFYFIYLQKFKETLRFPRSDLPFFLSISSDTP